ncbi:hypothetical protein Bca52824_027353 [Brassica carinata]|uniref:At2g35280-like TPR domain-containing protein n=1 Tax=Brassica carinata TaxID=52824 RepID=A0A8X7V8S4_BRACI|nr:hypothetical protein Bca52824_027353 [Brassica carinata]
MLSRGEKWFNLGGVSSQSTNNTHQINLKWTRHWIVFPGFNKVGREDHFYRSCCSNIQVKCYRSGNPESVYLRGMYEFFILHLVDEGREKIHLTSERGCELAQFVDGMLNLAFSVDRRGIVHNYPAFTRQHVYKMFQIICSWQLSGHWDYDKPGMFLSVAERIDPNVPRDCWCSHIDPPEFEVSLNGSRSQWKCDRCF